MIDLQYSRLIKAPRDVVWTTMLDEDTYGRWTVAFSPGSQYEGDWAEGEDIKFFDPDRGGTLAKLTEVAPPRKLVAEHVAVLSRDGEPDTESEMAKKWIGTIEEYALSEEDGATELRIMIRAHEDFRQMFEGSWPKALELLAELCEEHDE